MKTKLEIKRLLPGLPGAGTVFSVAAGTTKRFYITFVSGLLACAIVLICVWQLARPSEPVYEGKPLSRWLEKHVPTSSADPPYNSPGWEKADEALRHIGTNGIPTLLRMIRAKDPPPVALKLLDITRKQDFVKIRPYRRAYQRNEEAEYAFQVLGAKAASAVPTLIRIYEDRISASSQRCTALALGHIGARAKAATAVLLRDFTHTNFDVRFYAVSAVYSIGGEPDVVIPAFKSALKDSRREVRWNSASALANFGSQARSAVPDLIAALQDPAIREPVETALWRIAPEKVSKPLVIEESTPIVTNGVTAAAVDAVFNRERGTFIRAGTPVPCVRQFWNSEPRRVSLYRRAETNDHFLGEFEVAGIPPAPATANVSLLCVIVDQQIILCARDNRQKVFLEIRRVENEAAK